MAVVLKPCLHCGEHFPSKTSRALYCSPQCNALFHSRKKATSARFTIGNVEIVVNGVDPSTNVEKLRQEVIDGMSPQLLAFMHRVTQDQLIEHAESQAL